MNNKKLSIGMAAFVATIMTVGLATSAFAYQGDPSVMGPNADSETHAAVTAALESGDYAAWKEAMPGKGRIADMITEENFAKFVEMRNLRLAGDTEGADAIRTELGLGQRAGQGHGMRKGGGQGAQDGAGTRASNRGTRGQNNGGNFVDANGDGVCDTMQ